MARFDLSKTRLVGDLFKTPREERDQGWRERFFAAIVDASMATTPKQVLRAPDGFAYFILNLPPPGQSFEPFCISHILDVCLDQGCGVVVQPDADPPEWVFTYGNLWSLKEFGKFEMEQALKPGAGKFDGAAATASAPGESGSARSVLAGQPSESFLPAYARKVIKQFLAEKMANSSPRVLLVNDPHSTPAQSLVLSIFPEDFASQKDFEDLMYRLTWYLPRHYGLVSIAKDSDLAKLFEPL